ncbi:MAG: glycosyltransferase family 1 protein [Candidatus Moraniibacteriota bacterium]
MKIGIDASRAFLRRRTGIEEYSYQVIRHLRAELRDQTVVLYVRKKLEIRNSKLEMTVPDIDFDLPPEWQVKGLWAPRFWTQIRLSLEMLCHAPDVLFVPAHTVPLIHPRKTVVTVHGLEYEFSPESYGFWERLYMRWSIRFSVRVADRVIAVSENTKRDLMRLYAVPEKKIQVIYEGLSQPTTYNLQPTTESEPPYFLFIGRLETRKNIVRMIEAFEIFKAKTGLAHTLVLAGKPGFGYEAIRYKLQATSYKQDIHELGYVSEEEKWELLKDAEIFLFPSLYEGFGLPVIEAQSVGVPVITANTSSLPEVAGEGAVLVNPLDSGEIAEAMEMLVTDPEKRADIIEEATRNVDRFGWAQCAKGVAQAVGRPSLSG